VDQVGEGTGEKKIRGISKETSKGGETRPRDCRKFRRMGGSVFIHYLRVPSANDPLEEKGFRKNKLFLWCQKGREEVTGVICRPKRGEKTLEGGGKSFLSCRPLEMGSMTRQGKKENRLKNIPKKGEF